MIYVFLTVIALSIVGFIKFKKPALLLTPFMAIFAYIVVQIALVPMGFWETVRMILSFK